MEDAAVADAEVDTGVRDGAIDQDAGDQDGATVRDASTWPDSGYDAGYDAGLMGYTVTLSTAQEVSPCALAGPSATGTAQVTLGYSETYLSVTLTYENLSSAPTMAHIHYGAVNTNGPIVLSLGTSLDSPIGRSLNASNYYAAQGAPPTFAAFIPELKAGKAYLNLHTESCPDGEIRGQIQ